MVEAMRHGPWLVPGPLSHRSLGLVPGTTLRLHPQQETNGSLTGTIIGCGPVYGPHGKTWTTRLWPDR
jgi:hypothetical protein